jgi:hypothetical protein
LEIKVSFLGIHKWEPDIYIGFSPALHLQWYRKVQDSEGKCSSEQEGAGGQCRKAQEKQKNA